MKRKDDTKEKRQRRKTVDVFNDLREDAVNINPLRKPPKFYKDIVDAVPMLKIMRERGSVFDDMSDADLDKMMREFNSGV
jgi:hypothetical protein